MQRLYFLLILGLILQCKNEKAPNNFSVIKNYFYHEKSMIFCHSSDDPVVQKYIITQKADYDYNSWKPQFLIGFIKGTNTVFEYYYRNEGSKKIIDDEYESLFLFSALRHPKKTC